MKNFYPAIKNKINILVFLVLTTLVLSCESDGVNTSALTFPQDDEDLIPTTTTGIIKAEGIDDSAPGWGLSGTFSLYKGTDNVYYSSSLESISVNDYHDYAYFRDLIPGNYKLKFEFNPGTGYDGSNAFAVEVGKTTYIRLTYSWWNDYSWYYGNPE